MAKEYRILLVEDEDPMLIMMSAYLQRRGYAVTTARDGLEAEAALRLGPAVDLVLSDIRMPKADGLTLLKTAMKGDHPPAVILMTGHASVDSVLEAMRQGAYGYVKKPIMDLDGELGLMITRALSERRLKEENASLMARLKAATIKLASRQKVLDTEIEMAGHIQRSLLPDERLQCNGLRIESRRMIGEGVSGDFYDIIPLPEERTGIAMGAVLGRDLPAAILMASITGHLREQARLEVRPEAVLERANAGLLGVLDKGYKHFVSAFYGIHDPRAGTFSYACAGQPAPLLLRVDAPIEILPQASGPFLGKKRDPGFQCEQCRLVHGDRLFWFTDAVREIPDAHGREISIGQMVNWLAEKSPGDTEGAMTNFTSHVKAWNPALIERSHLLFLLADL